MPPISIIPIPGLPIIKPGDDLPALIVRALRPYAPQANDVIVVTSKIISKAEGRIFNLRDVTASPRAVELGAKTLKDPRLVELILQESVAVSRAAPNVLITQRRLGFVSANAAIDHSNTARDPDIVLLMPKDPDADAARLHAALRCC